MEYHLMFVAPKGVSEHVWDWYSRYGNKEKVKTFMHKDEAEEEFYKFERAVCKYYEFIGVNYSKIRQEHENYITITFIDSITNKLIAEVSMFNI